MPEYTFRHPETKETRSEFMGMNDVHEYVDEDGTKWDRIWHKPNASISSLSNVDPFNIPKLVEKTGQMKGNIGDLWQASAEASARRADKLGSTDPVKDKYFKTYEKDKGVKHFHDRPDKIETKSAIIDFKAKCPD